MRQQQLEYERHQSSWTPRRFTRVALIFGPLLVSAFLPIWTVWYVGPREATGKIGTLWSAFSTLGDNLRAASLSYVGTLWMSTFVEAGIMLMLGWGLERTYVLRGRRAIK